MRGFRKCIVAALLACALMDQTPRRPMMIAMVVNGGNVGSVPALQTQDALMVAIVPLARQVGVPVQRLNSRLAFQVHGSWVSIAANDSTVREGASPLMHLSSVPQNRNGTMYVTARDAGDLLDVDANVRPDRVVVTNANGKKQKTIDRGESFQVREIPVAKPTATPAPAVRDMAFRRDEPGADRRLVGHANLAVTNEGPNRTVNGMFDGGTQHVHGSLYVSRSGESRPYIGGTVHADAGSHGLDFGGVNDPLLGTVFAAGGTNGVALSSNGGASAFSVTNGGNTGGDRRRVVAFTRHGDHLANSYALAGANGTMQPLLGTESWNDANGRLFERDFWIGLHGVAGGFHYRSDGRFFTDSRLGFAGAGLPVGPGDVPEQATIGYGVSRAVQVRGGFGSGRGYTHAQSFLQASARLKSSEFTLSRYGDQTGVGVALESAKARGNIDVFRSSSYSGVSSQLEFAFARSILDAQAYIAGEGSQDIGFSYHLKRESPSLSVGAERIASSRESRLGPTMGYTSRVFGSMDIGVELHPLVHGNGLRITARQSLFAPLRSTNRFLLVGARDAYSLPVYVLVDGARRERLTSNATRVGIPAGTHYVALQSEDGKLASPEQRVTEVDSAPLTLPLWKVREVHGFVQIANAKALFGSSAPLENITVVMQPGNIVTQTDENGRFSFPAQALDPQTTITVDPESLTGGLAAPAAQKLADTDDVTLTIFANKKIEKVIF